MKKHLLSLAACFGILGLVAAQPKIENVKKIAVGDTYTTFRFDAVVPDGAKGLKPGLSYWIDGFEDTPSFVFADKALDGTTRGIYLSVKGLNSEMDYLVAPVLGKDEESVACTARAVAVTTKSDLEKATLSIDETTLDVNCVEAGFRWTLESLGGADELEVKALLAKKGGAVVRTFSLGVYAQAGDYVPALVPCLEPGTAYELKLTGGSAASKTLSFETPAEICGKARITLPNDGRGLTFIRSTREQWIDTGVVPTPSTSVEFLFARPVTEGWGIFFGQDNGPYHYAFGQGDGTVFFNGAGDPLGAKRLQETSNYVCRIDYTPGAASSAGTLSVGQQDGLFTTTKEVLLTADVGKTLGLFAFNGGGTGGAFDFQGMKIRQDGVLVRDFIPAVDGTGKACVFDRVSNAYSYDVRGVTPFVAGAWKSEPTAASDLAVTVASFDGETLVARLTRSGSRASEISVCSGPAYGANDPAAWKNVRKLKRGFMVAAREAAVTVTGLTSDDAYLRFHSACDGWSKTIPLASLPRVVQLAPTFADARVVRVTPTTAELALDIRAFGTGATNATLEAVYAYNEDPKAGREVDVPAEKDSVAPYARYVTDGLVAQWDPEEGLSATEWMDLVAGYTFAIKYGVYDPTNRCLVYTGKGYDALKAMSGRAMPAGAKTVELVAQIDTGVAIMAPGGNDCTIGEWNNGCAILHNGHHDRMVRVARGRTATYAVTYRNGNVGNLVCLDGVAQSFEERKDWFGGAGGRLTIGGRQDNGGNLNGRIFAIRVYDRVLGIDEIAANAEVDRQRFRMKSDAVGSPAKVFLPDVDLATGKGCVRGSQSLAGGVSEPGPARLTLRDLKPDTAYAVRLSVGNGASGEKTESETFAFRTSPESFGSCASFANRAVFDTFSDKHHFLTAAEGNLVAGIVPTASGNVWGEIAKLTNGKDDWADCRFSSDNNNPVVLTWRFPRPVGIGEIRVYTHWGDWRAVSDIGGIEAELPDGSWMKLPDSEFGGGNSGQRNIVTFKPTDSGDRLCSDVSALRMKFVNTDRHGVPRDWRCYRKIEVIEAKGIGGVIGMKDAKNAAGEVSATLERPYSNRVASVWAASGDVYGGDVTNAWANFVRLDTGFASNAPTCKVSVKLGAPTRYVRFFVEKTGWTHSLYDASVVNPVPVPRPVLARRLKAYDTEVYGIVHWGLNTYTDREWGFGNEDPKLLDPSAFDADQIVGACRDGGLSGLIFVAKHHDGFCLWPTKTTSHNITKSPFRGGKGDYVGEMAAACRKAGVKFGVYCSPWDRNSRNYGGPAYVRQFHDQVRELLDGRYGEVFEMWFDGANGGDGWYGGDPGVRRIPDGYYDFDKVFGFVRSLQPNVCIFTELRDDADFRWPCNEKGVLDPDSRATIRPFGGDYMSYGNVGDVGGTVFHPCEADFPLRPGWFCHEAQNGDVKPGEYLMKLYLQSVGNGGTMNIGIAPSKEGRLHEHDVAALRRFAEIRKEFFSTPASGSFNVAVMKEDIAKGERVVAWKLTAGGRELAKGRAIGLKRIRTFDTPVDAKGVKIEAFDASGKPVEVGLEVFLVDADLLKAVLAATDPAEAVDQHGMGAVVSSDEKSIVYKFEAESTFDRLRLVPDQSNLDGTPVEFKLFASADGKAFAEVAGTYRLDNVAANPIPQIVKLDETVKTLYLKLEAVRTLKSAPVSLTALAIAR